MGKFPIYTAIFSFLIVITAFVCLNTQNNIIRHNDEIKSPEIMIEQENDNSEVNDAETAKHENAPVNAALHTKTKYILKYDNGEVVLLTVYENGKKKSSPITTINIDYLTEIDRKSLTEGIELESMEDVFKIIEDFSS